jgi:hypothetical protein
VTYSCYDITQLCPSAEVGLRRSLSEGRALQAEIQADSGSSSEVTTTASTFGVLLESIGNELSNVLSSNPFALNLSKATAILAFMGTLVGFIFITLVFLLILDNNERTQKIYVRKEQAALAALLLQEDMKNGGKGDLGVSFHNYIYQLNSKNTMLGKAKKFTKSIKSGITLTLVTNSLKGESTTERDSQKESQKKNRNGSSVSFKTTETAQRRKTDARTMYETWTGNSTPSSTDNMSISYNSKILNLNKNNSSESNSVTDPTGASLKTKVLKVTSLLSAFNNKKNLIEEKSVEEHLPNEIEGEDQRRRDSMLIGDCK